MLILVSTFIGMGIGAGIIAAAKSEVKRLKAAIEKVQAMLDEYAVKMEIAVALETNLKFIGVSAQACGLFIGIST